MNIIWTSIDSKPLPFYLENKVVASNLSREKIIGAVALLAISCAVAIFLAIRYFRKDENLPQPILIAPTKEDNKNENNASPLTATNNEITIKPDPVIPTAGSLIVPLNVIENDFNVGKRLLEDKRYSTALPHFQAFLQKEPDHFESLSCLAECFRKRGEYSVASTYFKKAIKCKNGTSDEVKQVKKSYAKFLKGWKSTNIAEEAERLEKSLKYGIKEDISSRIRLGVIYYEMKNYKKAAQFFGEVYDKNRENLKVQELVYFANSLWEQKEIERAIEIYADLYKNHRTEIDNGTLWRFGDALRLRKDKPKGDIDLAIEIYKDLYNLAKEQFDDEHTIQDVQQSDSQSIENRSKLLMGVDPVDILWRYADLLRLRKDKEKEDLNNAIEIFKKCKDLGDNPIISLRYAFSLVSRKNKGDLDTAIEIFELFCGKEGNNDPTIMNECQGQDILARYGEALHARQNEGDLERAQKVFERALTFSKPIKRLETYGEVCRLGKKFAKAERIFREALNANPEDVFVLGRLADVLRLKGNLAEALEISRALCQKNQADIFIIASYLDTLHSVENLESIEKISDSDLFRIGEFLREEKNINNEKSEIDLLKNGVENLMSPTGDWKEVAEENYSDFIQSRDVDHDYLLNAYQGILENRGKRYEVKPEEKEQKGLAFGHEGCILMEQGLCHEYQGQSCEHEGKNQKANNEHEAAKGKYEAAKIKYEIAKGKYETALKRIQEGVNLWPNNLYLLKRKSDVNTLLKGIAHKNSEVNKRLKEIADMKPQKAPVIVPSPIKKGLFFGVFM